MQNLFERIWERKIAFLGTFFVVFTISYIVLMALDFLPEPPAAEEQATQTEEVEEAGSESSVEEEVDEEGATSSEAVPVTGNYSPLPVSIHINRLDKTVEVLNPTSRTIADLDAALLSGVVRHPDSANLSQDGNVFILGHSSYLPNVFNKNFQAFNGIQDLEWGDTIEVYSEDMVYEYRVEKVYRARAQDVTVPIADTGKMLTLATCNSFGTVDDRYIVEAKQTKERSL